MRTREDLNTGEAGGSAEGTLAGLRAQLDESDARLLDALRCRLDICRQIGEVKRDHRIPMMQPNRVGVVRHRAVTYAQAHGLSTEFFGGLYDQIIAEACRMQDDIIAAAGTTDPDHAG